MPFTVHCGGVNVQYQCQVTSVDYRRANSVTTSCKDGRSFVSNQVIVTVPLAVLKDGSIDFRPSLPRSIQQNVDRRGWGGGFKVFIEFNTSFRPYDWVCFPDDDNCYDYNDDGSLVGEQLFWDHITPAAPCYRGEKTLVAGYVIGSFAKGFAGMSESQVVAKILQNFAEYYGPYPSRGYRPGTYVRHLLLDWSDPDVKPFVRGTYSIRWPGYGGHRADDQDRIFLAGEAFPAPLDDEGGEYEEVGWVFTAMHSGQRAAELILDLPPPPPCVNDMSWVFINRKGKRLDCSWVERNPTNKRCRKKGTDGRRAKEACRKAWEKIFQTVPVAGGGSGPIATKDNGGAGSDGNNA